MKVALPLLRPGERRLAAALVSSVWAASLLAALCTSRPLIGLLSSLGLAPGELLESGSLMLLEVIRLERTTLLALGGVTLQLFLATMLLLMPARGLLLTFASLRERSLPRLLARAFPVVPRLFLQQLGVLVVASGFGFLILLLTAPLHHFASDTERWFQPAVAVPLGGLSLLASQYTLLLADAWALGLARSARSWRSFVVAFRLSQRPRLLLARVLKSLLVLGLAGLGWISSAGTSYSWFSLASTQSLGWLLVALDLAWYLVLSRELDPAGALALSAGCLQPGDRAEDADEPGDPTPDPDA